ncbi:MAG: tRNA lysidine(34) synthetase TilS [Proteobacteria bacterium]|nr:tRNA lysidine(34) synthetase TilS [Pseudomonadota bacterium]
MTVLVACSGGLDSMVLARLEAARSDGPIVLACLDHGLRTGAAEDVAFVRALAAELGADFVTDRRAPDPQRTRRVGRQAAARELRYAWLEEAADAVGAHRILLAHHRDDDLETIALGLPDPTPESLQAAARAEAAPPSMPRIRGRFGRPLLDRTRASLRALAEAEGWSWCEDPSNRDQRYVRNRMRASVIPAWRAIDPEGPRRLLALGRRARAARNELHRRARLAMPAVVRSDEPLRLDRTIFAALPDDVADAVVRMRCTPTDRPLGTRAVAALIGDARARGPARLRRLGGGWTARTAGTEVLLSQAPLSLEGDAPARAPLTLDAPVAWAGGWALGASQIDGDEARRLLADPGAGRRFALLDADTAEAPLMLQSAGAGTRIRPFGMNGSRLVRDVLAEDGVPRPDRAGWPTVVDARGRVLWIPGVRAGAAAPLRTGCDAALLLYTVAAPDFPDRAALERS